MYYGHRESGHSEGIWNGFKSSFRKGTSLTQLIYINIGIFVIFKLIDVVSILTGQGYDFYSIWLEYAGVPADPEFLAYRPWTLLTYMFTQFEFLHLLFNMLWLYWFGTFFLDHFSSRKLLTVYLLGGISGAFLYILAYNTVPFLIPSRLDTFAIGASASVMAIVFAVCTYLPKERIYIFLIGPVKLITLAIFTAVIDIISIPSGNAGGHIAHLGGALFGYFFILGIKRDHDVTRVPALLLEKLKGIFSHRKKMKVKYKKSVPEMNDREYNEYKKERDKTINLILDKISHSGYESLTTEEKEILFKNKN